MRTLCAAALLATLALCGPACAGEHGGKDPMAITPILGPPTPLSDKMTEVQRLQAQTAQGDKAAYEASRAKLKALGQAFATAPPEAFKIKSERDAAIVYLLSGGAPRDLGPAADPGRFPQEERNLLRGAIGYAIGRQTDAEALLGYDPVVQSIRLGSQLAYAQSVLTTSKDPKKSLALLDLARLLSPGGLIEEAALRREILLVGDLHDADRVAFLARQYVGRFGHSLYAANFVQGLIKATLRFDLCADLAGLEKFSALLRLVTVEQRDEFLLAIARSSAMLGRFELAAEAAKRALAPTPARAEEAARARLYVAISSFFRMPDGEAIAAFAAVDPAKVNAADRGLLSAATFVQSHLRELPPLAQYADIWRETAVAAARSPDLELGSGDAAVETIRRAVTSLARYEALISERSSP